MNLVTPWWIGMPTQCPWCKTMFVISTDCNYSPEGDSVKVSHGHCKSFVLKNPDAPEPGFWKRLFAKFVRDAF